MHPKTDGGEKQDGVGGVIMRGNSATKGRGGKDVIQIGGGKKSIKPKILRHIHLDDIVQVMS